jgi:hypothetical protein
MPLILAIEPDRRQAAQLSAVVRKRVDAELILVDTTELALDAIGNRMPDLVLVPALLSPQDDAALAAALRVIAAAANVQMLTIPVLGTPRPAASPGGMLSVLRRKPKAAEPDGCDPVLFAEQIASYLERAAEERPRAIIERAEPETAQPERAVPESVWPEMAAAPDAPGAYESPSLRAIAAVERPTWKVEEPVNEEPVNKEWLEPSQAERIDRVEVVEVFEEVIVSVPEDRVSFAIEEPFAAAPDEGVSFAVEEAVRALFSDPPPAAFDAAPRFAAPVETLPEPAFVAASYTENVAAENAAAAPPKQDEWAEVEELMAALQLMPLAAIEVTGVDDWIAPVPAEPRRAAEVPAQRIHEPASGDIASSLAPAAAKSEREWVALIESLRHDVERLRVERAEKPGRKAAAAAKAARPERPAKPVQDEWGFFDPQQCGFAALLAKLDEVTDSEDVNH